MSAAARPARLFGTDGIRGAFGEPPLDASTVARVATSLGEILVRNGDRPTVVLGGDTRASTDRIAAWMVSGLERSGVRTRWAGTLPTPGISFLARELGAATGVAISASHNPYPDNGIKLIGPAGFKWPRGDEEELEELAHRSLVEAAGEAVVPRRETELFELYRSSLVASLAGERPLAGLRVALDCANGAAYRCAPAVFRELGATIEVLAAEPDGSNINRDCGSTHPERLQALCAAGDWDLGIAFDGDADRALLVDGRGELRDGDHILYLWALDLLERGELEPRRIAATTMSNLGLEHALARHGVELVRCGVGDRTLVDRMRATGIELGGEQSGHIVRMSLSHTGDGILTAVQLADLIARRGRPLSEQLADFERYPQILLNVRVREKVAFDERPVIAAKAAEVERRLEGTGRLVLRYSGTEPLARVMIEGQDQTTIEALAGELADTIAAELGAEEVGAG